MKREEELTAEVEFLLARLDELEWDDCPSSFWRDWNGHVEPSISRLRHTLSSLLATSKPEATHSDDEAVDRFAAAMKAKLAKKRDEGRGGWEDKSQCSNEFLTMLLRDHVQKGDPVDVANLAMMIHQRSERIAKPQPTEDISDGNNVSAYIVQASLDKARQVLEATEGAAHEKGWRPIETAPKDGYHVLLYCDYYGVGRCAWESWRGVWRSDDPNHGIGFPQPTHWMPLPDAPEGSARALNAENAYRTALTAKEG